MTEEEKSIQQWFRDKGFRCVLEIGRINVSLNPARPDFRADPNQKYANIDRIKQGSAPRNVRRYKMSPSDTTEDSLRRAKGMFELEYCTGQVH